MLGNGGARPVLLRLGLLAASLAISLLPAIAQNAHLLDPSPGTYRDSIIVSPSQPNLELTAGFEGGDWGVFDFSEPIVLDAYPGQSRTYRLRLEGLVNGEFRELGSYEYTVDKTIPVLPELSPVPGRYYEPLTVDLGAFQNKAISVRVNGATLPEGQKELTLWGRPGQVVTYSVEIIWDDESQFNAQPLQAEYSIDLRQKASPEPALEILSPAQGRFRNPQLLYLNHAGVSSIRYTIDGSDPQTQGIPYTEPVELAGENLRLRVAAQAADGSILERELAFSAGTEAFPGVVQGYLGSSVDLAPVGQGFTYVTSERSPGTFDPNFSRALRIRPQAGTLRTFVLRLRNLQSQAPEYRIFFLLEGRSSTRPELYVQRQDSLGNIRYLKNPATLFPEDILLPSGSREFFLEAGFSDFGLGDGAASATDAQLVAERVDSPKTKIGAPRSVRDILSALGLRQLPAGGARFSVYHAGAQGLRSEAITLQVRDPQPIEGSPRLVALSASASIAADSGSVYYGIADQPLLRVSVGSGWAFSIPRAYRSETQVQFWSVLEDGRAGQLLESSRVVLENLPPAGPVIVTSGRSVSIESNERVFYRVVSPRANAPSVLAEYQPYLGPIDLVPIAGDNTAYRVEAHSIDSDEVRSTVSRTPMLYLNERPAARPELIGIAPDQVTGLEHLNLSIANFEAGFHYSYKLFVGDASFAQGSFEAGHAVIELPLVDATARLEMRTESRDLTGQLPALDFSIAFRIDRIAPLAPLLSGAESGKYARAQSVSLTNPAPEDALLFYSINDGQRQLYSGPLHFDAAPETLATWKLSAFTQDNAGNTSVLLEREYIIDREPPPVPEYEFVDASGNTVNLGSSSTAINRDLELRFSSIYPLRVEVSTTQVTPTIPTVFSPLYNGPIRLSAPQGEQRLYRFLYRAEDEVGNLSAVPRLLEIRIDKTVPDVPQEPVVLREGNSGLLEWTAGSDTIFYRFESQSEFRMYSSSVPWQIPPGAEGIGIVYYLQDDAGNRSPEARFLIPRRNQTTRPAAEILPAAAVYSSLPELRVQATRPNSLVRYELSINAAPRDVNETSPVWSGIELAEPIQGETLRYSIALRQFEPGFEASELVQLSFVVDRTPPAPPNGSLPPSFLSQEGVQLEFESSEPATNASAAGIAGSTSTVDATGASITSSADSIFYTVESRELPSDVVPNFSGLPESAEVDDSTAFRQATGPVNLPGEAGKAIQYLVRAISRDQAGNFSDKSRIWEIIVDRASIFVSAQASAAGNVAGSRQQPFASLQDALSYARAGERGNIFLAQGSYSLEAPLDLAGGKLSISGGYDENWSQIAAETILVPSNAFSGTTLFRVTGNGQLQLSAVYVTDPFQRLSTIASVEGARLQLGAGVTLAAIGELAAIHASSQAVVQVQSARIRAYDPQSEALIYLDSGARLSFVDSFVEYDSAPAFLGEPTRPQKHSTISASQAFITIENAVLDSYRAREGSSIQLAASELVLKNSQITGPDNSELGIAIHGTASRMRIESSTLRTSASTGVAVLVRADSSVLNIIGGEIISAARGSASLIVGSGPGTSVDLVGTVFSETAVADLLTVFQMSNAALSVREARVRGPLSSREIIFASLDSSDARIFDSELNLSASGRVIAFYVPRRGSLEVRNNSISGGSNSVAIYSAAGSSPMQITGNGFSGWTSLLVRSSQSASPLAPDAVFRDVASLEAISADDQIFSGNRIDRGF